MIILNRFDGIIFDFNGTLFFDSRYHESAWLYCANNELGFKIDRDFYYKNMHGRSNPEIYAALYKKPVPKEQYHSFGQRKEEVYREMCRKGGGCRLAPGAEELLDWLKEKNIPFMIATSSEKNNMDFFEELFGLSKWFSKDRLLYDDGSFRGKPHPDIYLTAAKRLGLPPNRLIVAEDSHSGILAARAAGAGFILGVTEGDPSAFADGESCGAVINNFSDFNRELLMKNHL